MVGIARQVVDLAYTKLTGPSGAPENLEVIGESEGIADLRFRQIQVANVGTDVAEKASGAQYPSVQIYCEKLSNGMKEKFRVFSGEANLRADVRVSQDRLEGLELNLQRCVDAVLRALDQHRGDWGGGVTYGGGYEVSFQGVKKGGRNYLQMASVRFDVDVSK
jgi:hypothetical protein